MTNADRVLLGALPIVLPSPVPPVRVRGDALAEHVQPVFGPPDRSPGVVLSPSAGLLADAAEPFRVVVVDGSRPARRPRGRAAAASVRLVAHARMRLDVRRAVRDLSRQGLPRPRVLQWEPSTDLDLTGGARRPPVYRPRRYPPFALVVQGPRSVTILEQAAMDAQQGVAHDRRPVEVSTVRVSEGSLVARTPGGVLRLGIGPGEQMVTRPAQALDKLMAAAPKGSRLVGVLPRMLASGRVDPAAWTLEQTMPGREPPRLLEGELLDDCLTVLAELRRLPSSTIPAASSLVELASRRASSSSRPDEFRVLAREAERIIAPYRGGVSHGDFWHQNMLRQGGRLSGLVDWDSSVGRAAPFADLMHLLVTMAEGRGDDSFGRSFVGTIVPVVEGRHDDLVVRHAGQIGLEPTTDLLWAAAVSSWLSHVDYQLLRYEKRREDRVWLTSNVDAVAAALSAARPVG